MSIKLINIATAQGVGSSPAVDLNVTPFMAKDSGMAIIQPTAGSDRIWTLEKSDDNAVTWSLVITGNNAELVLAEVKMGEKYRMTVAGGTVGTVTALVAA